MENAGILYVFPIFHTAGWGQKIRCSAKDDLFRGSLDLSGGMNMKEQLEQIKANALTALEAAATPAALEELRVKLLGKKGELTAVLKQMGKLSAEERPVMGQLANSVRASIEEELEKRKADIHAAALEAKLASEAIDVTIPGKAVSIGHQHPMNQVLQTIKDIFLGLGYQVVDGPEVELADYNFTRLNIEEGHPSRDRSDTFYFTDDDSVLLRTQTSPMQIRYMEKHKPPLCMLAPGRVFRKDEADATHSPMFHQIEGLVVAEDITMGDLKGALTTIMRKIYGEDAVMRFRPHHFPFTEPSCEMDMQCHKCHGTGEIDGQVCSTCHGEGWIELLGAGMVHPKVLENCGIDPEKYSGFAFGMGLERMAMGRMKINDLRLIFDNDIRFLNQF
jgi:phenylalanine--tRNA ligase, alpha subunit